MAKINISNLNKNRKINPREVRKVSRFAIRRACHERTGEINLVFVNNAAIKRLNRKYKRKNSSTDVLCFCFFEGMPFEDIWEGFKADIYISSDKAFTNSKRFRTSFKRELYLYIIHGILHMCGFRDNTLNVRKKMGKMQEKLLSEFLGDRK